jgi:hypothetical protein
MVLARAAAVDGMQDPLVERTELKDGEFIPGLDLEAWAHPEVLAWDITD